MASEPSIAKSFAPSTIASGGISTLTITIDNTQANSIALSALALNDVFPADVVIAATPNGANTCGGTLTATAGANNIDLSGGALGASASCTFQADVTAPSAGAKANNIPAAALNNAEGLDAAADANDTLTVTTPPAVVLVGSWTDEPDYNTNGFSCTPAAGSNRVVLVMVTAESNAAGTMDMGSVSLGGQALTAIQNPNGVTVGTGGGYHNIVWLGYLDESGIALMSGNAVTMSWDVAPNVTFGEDKVQCATYENVDQTTPVIDEASFSNTSAATIQAGPVAVGEGDRLVYATVAGQPGNHTAPAGYTEHIEQDGPTNDLSNASVSRDATTASPTEDPLASWSLTTRLAIISAVLNYVPATTEPSIAKSFAPSTIAVGGISTLTITIDNTQAGAIALSALALNDVFPADVEIAAIPNGANTCGGVLTATAGANNIDLSGGALSAGASCTFQADVTAPSAGAKANNIPAAALNNAESLDAAADANDTLTVSDATLTLADHDSGQIGDQFATTTPVSTEEFFAFKLSSTGTVTVDNIRVNFSVLAGVVNGDVTNGQLYRDNNSNGVVDGGDVALAIGVTPVAGVLDFSGFIETPGAGVNYLVRATVSNLVENDRLVFSMGTADIDEVEGGVTEGGSVGFSLHIFDGTSGDVYYSVGTNTGELKTGSPTITITNGTATLSEPQTGPGNVGVGDEIIYGGSTVYIKEVLSPTQFVVHIYNGSMPADASATAITSIMRTWNSLTLAEEESDELLGGGTSDHDLPSLDVNLTWMLYNDGVIPSSTFITLWTTDATHMITITAAGAYQVTTGVSQRHAGRAGTGAVITTACGVEVIAVNEDFVTVEWLEIMHSTTGCASQPGIQANPDSVANLVTIRSNIIHNIEEDVKKLVETVMSDSWSFPDSRT